MDDLVVDDEFSAAVVDDESTHTATTIIEGTADLSEETTLVNNGQTLLDITSLGHADNGTILSDVEDSVLLEDGSEHALNDDRWLWVALEGALFVKGAGEEVDTKVSVLTSLAGLRDSDDLGWTALEDEEVADSDEVTWDGHSIAGNSTTGFNISD